ncbi:MAG: phage integrase SAM-like domain-containing protein [Bacteroidota bacterium]
MKNIVLNVLERYYILRPSRDNSGKVTIYLRAYVNGQTALLGTTGVKIDPVLNWCKKTKTVKNTNNNLDIENLSDRLEGCKNVLNDIVRHYNKENILLNSKTLRVEFERAVSNGMKFKSKETTSLIELYELYITDFVGRLAYNTHRDYIYKKDKLKAYFEASKLPDYVGTINKSFCYDYKKWLKEHFDNSESSANKHIMRIKVVLDYAYDIGKIDKNPIHEVKTPQRYDTDLFHLNEPMIKKLYDYPFFPKAVRKVVDMFVFSCESGLAYIDLIALTSENVKQNNNYEYLQGNRQKTGTLYTVILSKRAKLIIEKYGSVEGIPKISNQKCNQYIKNAFEMLDFADFEKVKFHSGRKSFAHNGMNGELQITEEDIIKMLGQKNVRELASYGLKESVQILDKYAPKLMLYNN